MLPTLQSRNILLTEKLSTRFDNIHRGDVVTVYVPEYLEEKKDTIIKRVIGVAGDTVEIKDGRVFVNKKQLSEDYINGDTTLPVDIQYSKVTVPKGSVYVLGDNRLPNASKDSRIIGPVEMKRLRGKVLLRIFPLNEIGTLKK